MKRRSVFKAAALAFVSFLVPRRARSASAAPGAGSREMIAVIGDVVLPTTLGVEGRRRAVAAFTRWLDEYRAGVPMSYGYGNDLQYSVVPPSPAERYPAQFKRLEELAVARGAAFPALPPAGRKAVLEAALEEAGITELPERPDGRHVATDLLSHFYSSSDGNDFLFNALIGVSGCRGLAGSGDRPASLPYGSVVSP